MAKESGPMSGFRDLLADQMIPRDNILGKIREVYEGYGFVPLKTPALERYETMTGKYGDEGEKLMYKFEDNGGRKLAMRYDQTVPLARVVAQHGNELPSPYKRYAVGEVWRGESPQAGRYREFTQFDADTVGSSSYLADTEIIAMMSDAMSALDINTLIRVNDRSLLDGLAVSCGITTERNFRGLIGIIDKVDKIGQIAVSEEIESNFNLDTSRKVRMFIENNGNSEDKLNSIEHQLNNNEAKRGIDNLRKIMAALRASGYSEEQIVFDPTIARGLDYYTGTIYETTLLDLPTIGSVCSGGRFDNLIEAMGGPSLPAVGTSVGVDRLLEGMRQLGKIESVKTNTKVFVTNIDPQLENDYFSIVQQLRHAGLATELYLGQSPKLGNQLKAIGKLGVRYVIIFGSEEKQLKQVQLKDMESGNQQSIALDSFVKQIKKTLGM